MAVKISIIIPSYNVGEYIGTCLDSLLDQSLRELEIIVVDDASTDNTVEVIKSYISKDERIKLLENDSNSSAYISRKRGIEAASGKYIMFVDGDDFVEVGACEYLYLAMEKNNVDILHFGTNILNSDNLPQKRIDSMLDFLEPYDGFLYGREVFEACFKEKKYRFSLWNKIFNSLVCKKAAECMKDEFLPKGQDKLTYFIISFFAKSYLGVKGVVFYNYRFGAGITGHNYISIEQFKKYNSMAHVADSMKVFLDEQNAEEDFYLSYESAKDELLADCINQLDSHIKESDYAKGFELLIENWGIPEAISGMAKRYWWRREKYAELLDRCGCMPSIEKTVKKIGTFYFRIENGGAQRVVTELANLWIKMGYEVSLFTDFEPTENDYYIDTAINRTVLTSTFDTNRDNYIKRAILLEKSIRQENIDVLVYHGWMSPLLLWDCLICKLLGVKVYVHTHSVFSFPLISISKSFAELPRVFALLDGIITLSPVDYQYWKKFNKNVWMVSNPFSKELDGTASKPHDGINLLYVGRLSYEKKPLDAIRAFEIVHQRHDNTKLIIVGDSISEQLYNSLTDYVHEHGLDDAVSFEGFQSDVRKYYEIADIQLITSGYEGFPLALIESKECSVPCAMYELPYLSLYRDRGGLVTAPVGNIDCLAEVISEWISGGKEKLKEEGNKAYHSIDWLRQYAYSSVWEDIFAERPVAPDWGLCESNLWETIFDFYMVGFNSNLQLKNRAERLAAENEGLHSRVHQLEHSYSYRLGLLLTYIPRTIVKTFLSLLAR